MKIGTLPLTTKRMDKQSKSTTSPLFGKVLRFKRICCTPQIAILGTGDFLGPSYLPGHYGYHKCCNRLCKVHAQRQCQFFRANAQQRDAPNDPSTFSKSACAVVPINHNNLCCAPQIDEHAEIVSLTNKQAP